MCSNTENSLSIPGVHGPGQRRLGVDCNVKILMGMPVALSLSHCRNKETLKKKKKALLGLLSGSWTK